METGRGALWAILVLLILGSTFAVNKEDKTQPECCPDKKTWLALTQWFLSRECANDRCCITDREWQIWGDIIDGIFSAKCRHEEGRGAERTAEGDGKDSDAKSESESGREGEKQKRFGFHDYFYRK